MASLRPSIFLWVRDITRTCGLKLKQPLYVTVAQTDGLFYASTPCLKTTIAGPDYQATLNLLVRTLVTRYLELHAHRFDIAPHLYDEWRELSRYVEFW